MYILLFYINAYNIIFTYIIGMQKHMGNYIVHNIIKRFIVMLYILLLNNVYTKIIKKRVSESHSAVQ